MESSWTQRQNKEFEKALAKYDIETPDKWQNIANEVGKTVEEVKRQFEILKEDVRRIERGQVPFPYRTNNSNRNCGGKKWSTVYALHKGTGKVGSIREGNKESKELKIEMIG
ncbi:hypothetical protein ACSQ67_007707 [Phaseolus vulgaris]